jgi:hypothetical protein
MLGDLMARQKSFTTLLASGDACKSHAIPHDPINSACLSSCQCVDDSSGAGCTFEYCPLLHNRKRALPEGRDDGEASKHIATPLPPPLSIT